jgi:hypothetical protein
VRAYGDRDAQGKVCWWRGMVQLPWSTRLAPWGKKLAPHVTVQASSGAGRGALCARQGSWVCDRSTRCTRRRTRSTGCGTWCGGRGARGWRRGLWGKRLASRVMVQAASIKRRGARCRCKDARGTGRAALDTVCGEWGTCQWSMGTGRAPMDRGHASGGAVQGASGAQPMGARQGVRG